MSKIIFAVLVSVFLSGCGTTNPGMQAVQQGAGVAAGAALGWYGAKALGSNRPVAMVAAVAGGTLGAVVVSGNQCAARGDCPKQGGGVEDPSYYGGRCQHDDPAIVDRCTRDWAKFGAFFDSDNCWGTWDTCARIVSRRRGIDISQLRRPGEAGVEKNPTEPAAKEGALYGGLTVKNYKQSDIIDPECKTGNYGRDARCLKDQADKLAGYQKACEETGKDCSPTFNYGKASRSVGNLAGLLLLEQTK